MPIKTKHLLTGNELDSDEIQYLINLASQLKANRNAYAQALLDQHLALIFEKPSLRTRFSFTVAMRELGGDVIESMADTRKLEEPEDQIRVLQGYCQAVMIRTFEDSVLQRMQVVSQIPIINGLSNLYHPCQTLADLMTLQEKFKTLQGLKVCYLGDGNNVLHSLLLMAPKMGVNINYCCPTKLEPHPDILKQIVLNKKTNLVSAFSDPKEAVQGCQAVYTDVWTSMGFKEHDENLFRGFQVNEELMSLAHNDAIFMHCMPMNRGKEVSVMLPDLPCSVIFQQSENRMHVQKALLLTLLT